MLSTPVLLYKITQNIFNTMISVMKKSSGIICNDPTGL